MTKWGKRLGSLMLVAALLLSGILPGLAAEVPTGDSYVYQVEEFYSGDIKEDMAADMQPGQSIEIPLNTNPDFVAGTYTLTVRSCGNRESFDILVNGESVGQISRKGTGFGQNEMTEDALAGTLTLKPEDVVTIVAPDDGTYGWVDYLRLDKTVEPMPEGATETGDGYYLYHTEFYYDGEIKEDVAADMQPGESIEIPLNTNPDFVAGTYTLTVRSCGNRESFDILVNGESVGQISRKGTGFGQNEMTEDALEGTLTLKPEDVVTIVAPAEGYGWVDYLRLDKTVEPMPEGATETGDGYYLYHTEFYYSGEIKEDVAADLQPGQSIEIALNTNPDFVAGTYTLTVRSCGNRESFDILVNGESVGQISRKGTGFGQNEMTEDALEGTLTLKPEDVVTIVAPDDGTYGWVDYLRLDKTVEPLPEGATETGDGYYIYHTEFYYNGDIKEDMAADLQPGQSIEIALNTNPDFVAGTYTLTVRSCGNRESFDILVNGESVGQISRKGTGFGQDQMTNDALEGTLTLKPEDVVTIVAPAEGYGWVDYLRLDKTVEPMPEGATETGDGYYLYHTEFYYDGDIKEDVAADMQPGQSIEIALNTNPDFVAGTYTLTVRSCGNRESFDILVNGKSVGQISRKGTGFGQNEMTEDALEGTLTLKPEDVVTIVAPDDGTYGWVDYLRLDKTVEPLPEGATETGDGYYLYHTEFYYDGDIKEDVAADMQPGQSIEIALNTNPDFVAGTYTLTVRSCGNRESFDILVNGESVGQISRKGTDFGQDQMTDDALEGTLTLKPEDVVTIVAPDDGTYGWVDYLRLDKTVEPLPEGATETGDGYYIYHTEFYYDGDIKEDVTADLQPGESIEIPLNTNPDFVAGTYTLTVRSCGNRESFDILVNGESVGQISRKGTNFGQDQMTNDALEGTLTLKPEDVVTIVAPAEGYGWVDYLRLDKKDEGEEEPEPKPELPEGATETGDGYYLYHTEFYYDGDIKEDVAADMQPGESIEIPLNTNPDFVAGTYTLTVRSCGNRESFDILVNGESVGQISRKGTGFGQDQMTNDTLEGTLTLKPEDVVTIVAPEGSYWGWVDYLRLDKKDEGGEEEPEPQPEDPELPQDATKTGDGYFLYELEYFYNGPTSEGVAADLQPGKTIEVALSANPDFVAGTYTLTIRSCGNRESFEILVNGKSVGTITRKGTGFGQNQMTDDRLAETVSLKPGDVVTIVAPEGSYWGWTDYLRLDLGDRTQEKPPEPERGPGTETGEGYFIYQAEAYYSGAIIENVAADLQPGETLTFRLKDNPDFVAGTYTLTVRSCGNREHFTVLVNGKNVGTIDRKGTGFGQDQMTYDKLPVTLDLKPGDTLSLVAPGGEIWGWVDFIVLDVGDKTGTKPPELEGNPTETGEDYYLYQAEFFYDRVSENAAADLQPGTVIDIPLNANPDFPAGWYILTVASCGTRQSIHLRINGKVIGSVARQTTGYGMDQMTLDRFSRKVQLSPEDVLTLSAPDDGTYGWVDYVMLTPTDPPKDAQPETNLPSEPPAQTEATSAPTTEPEQTATEPEKPQEPEAPDLLLPAILGGLAVLGAAGAIGTLVFRKRKR